MATATEVLKPRAFIKPFTYHKEDPCDYASAYEERLEKSHPRLVAMLKDRAMYLERTIAEELNKYFPINEIYSVFNPWEVYLEYTKYSKGELNGESIEYYSFRDGSFVCEYRETWYASKRVKGQHIFEIELP